MCFPSAKENRIANLKKESKEYEEFKEYKEFRSSGVQEFRSSGVQEFRSSGVQEFRSSGVQEFRSSGVRVVRERKNARKKGFCDPHPRPTRRYRSGLLNSCNSLNS